MMFTVMEDASVCAPDGRILFYSFERFANEVVSGSNCFICGAAPNSTEFNDEHVLPDWMLRRYKLHDRVISIPNKTSIKYGQLRIPCCRRCNSEMGTLLEEPFRNLLDQGYECFARALPDVGWPLYVWMSLIFLKAHLKDKYLRVHRDLREPDTKIGEIYSWEDLHHTHCIARSFHTQCDIDSKTMGSLMILPAKRAPHLEDFDYIDLHASQTMLLRIDSTAIVTVLNDGGAVAAFLTEKLPKIEGPLSPLQLREITAQAAFAN
jgi:hypothetical protein